MIGAIIMPAESSSSSHAQPTLPPFLSFFGPDSTQQIKAMDASGFEVARFAVNSPERRSYNISRLIAPGQPPNVICTAHKSSLSGKTHMTVHGHDVELGDSTMGLQMRKQAVIPSLEKAKWSGDDSLSGKRQKLVDANKQVIARASLKELRMDVFMPGDEMVLDFLLASYVALVKAKNAEAGAAEWVDAGANVIGALAGGGGGG